MSASTPTVQGGTRNLPLGAALMAIVLAIVVVAALVAIQAIGSRGQTQTQVQAVTAPPYTVAGDHGWATDGRAAAAPVLLELPRPFDPSTMSAPAGTTLIELPRSFDPSTLSTPVGGGRGTRFAR